MHHITHTHTHSPRHRQTPFSHHTRTTFTTSHINTFPTSHTHSTYHRIIQLSRTLNASLKFKNLPYTYCLFSRSAYFSPSLYHTSSNTSTVICTLVSGDNTDSSWCFPRYVFGTIYERFLRICLAKFGTWRFRFLGVQSIARRSLF